MFATYKNFFKKVKDYIDNHHFGAFLLFTTYILTHVVANNLIDDKVLAGIVQNLFALQTLPFIYKKTLKKTL